MDAVADKRVSPLCPELCYTSTPVEASFFFFFYYQEPGQVSRATAAAAAPFRLSDVLPSDEARRFNSGVQGRGHEDKATCFQTRHVSCNVTGPTLADKACAATGDGSLAAHFSLFAAIHGCHTCPSRPPAPNNNEPVQALELDPPSLCFHAAPPLPPDN